MSTSVHMYRYIYAHIHMYVRILSVRYTIAVTAQI